MSEDKNSFVSVGMPVGPARLTISAPNVTGLSVHLNDLTEVDPVDGVSAISGVIENIQMIDAAATLVFIRPTAPAVAAPSSIAPNIPSDGKTCAHGAMRYKEGTSKQGKPYKGWFCTQPMGQGQCPAQFAN